MSSKTMLMFTLFFALLAARVSTWYGCDSPECCSNPSTICGKLRQHMCPQCAESFRQLLQRNSALHRKLSQPLPRETPVHIPYLRH